MRARLSVSYERRRDTVNAADPSSYGLVLMVFNAEMTNTPYLAIFMRADHVSFRWLLYPDYLVPEKYCFRRFDAAQPTVIVLSRNIKLLPASEMNRGNYARAFPTRRWKINEGEFGSRVCRFSRETLTRKLAWNLIGFKGPSAKVYFREMRNWGFEGSERSGNESEESN